MRKKAGEALTVHPGFSPLALTGAMVLLLTGCGPSVKEPPARTINPFPLPEFELPTTDGQTLSSQQARGHISIITFWTAWSPSAVRQAADLVDLQERYRENGIKVFAIALNEGPGTEDIEAFIEHSRINYPVGVADGDFHHQFNSINAIPSTFIVAPEGQVINRYTGVALPEELDREVRYLLALEEEKNRGS